MESERGLPEFFYETASSRRFLRELSSYLSLRRGFFLLIGERGSGKSTLLKRLKRVLPERYFPVFLDGDFREPKEVFVRILEVLGRELDFNGGLGLRETFSGLLRLLLEKRKEVLILADDAEKMKESVILFLIKLSFLESPVLKMFHLVLAGDEKLVKKLSKNEFKGIIPSNIHFLSPMRFDELGPYVNQMLNFMQRLDVKVRQGDLPFLYSVTSGNFGKVTEAVNKALSALDKSRGEVLDRRSLYAVFEVEPQKKSRFFRFFLILLAILVFLLLVPQNFEGELYLKALQFIQHVRGYVP